MRFQLDRQLNILQRRLILAKIVITGVMIIAGLASMQAQPPASIPDPTLSGSGKNFVYDPNHLLTDDTLDGVNELINDARSQSTCEIAVAVVDNLNGQPIEDYSYELFKHWGVGKSDKDNGVLVVIAPKEKQARIEVGYGAEGVLTDLACSKLIRRRVTPMMKQGKVNQAVYGVVNDIERTLRSKTFAKELRSENADTTMRRIRTISPSAFWRFVKYVVICVFLFTLILFFVDFFGTRGKRNYRRAMTWRNHRGTYIWGSILSLGTALPIAFLAWRFYKHARNKTEICDTCGAKMKKLSEEDDNAYLTPKEDFEEKLGTVDYDVWLCPDCGTVERFPYVERQLKYRECPECHAIAMNLAMDKILRPATTKHTGLGERAYQCQFCHHVKREEYVIPKEVDTTALAAAAAIGAMAAGRGGGGGMNRGSGFGGGRSGGGGASGSW